MPWRRFDPNMHNWEWVIPNILLVDRMSAYRKHRRIMDAALFWPDDVQEWTPKQERLFAKAQQEYEPVITVHHWQDRSVTKVANWLGRNPPPRTDLYQRRRYPSRSNFGRRIQFD